MDKHIVKSSEGGHSSDEEFLDAVESMKLEDAATDTSAGVSHNCDLVDSEGFLKKTDAQTNDCEEGEREAPLVDSSGDKMHKNVDTDDCTDSQGAPNIDTTASNKTGFNKCEPTEPLHERLNAPDEEKGDPEASDDDESNAPEPQMTDIDEDGLKERDSTLTDDEKLAYRDEAQTYKEQGNKEFKEGDYGTAAVSYTEALQTCPLNFLKERSIMYSNRAACRLKLEKTEEAIQDSCRALELNPNYLKALLRRAELYEKNDKLDESLADYTKALEMDPSQRYAREACMRLPEQIIARNEKMKTEMLSKLKDLGNMVLRPFGMSTDNFNMQQDPNTGSYSMSFNQNPPQQ